MVKIMTRYGPKLLARLDAAAEEDEVSRSEMIRALLKMALDICDEALGEESGKDDEEEDEEEAEEEVEDEREGEDKTLDES